VRGDLQAAQDNGCALSLMASHGRRCVQGFLPGNQAQKVLTPMKIPVPVLR
jgi:hypothetical protein